eukprot:13494614-Alexandrium_andersonii.AAC.1
MSRRRHRWLQDTGLLLLVHGGALPAGQVLSLTRAHVPDGVAEVMRRPVHELEDLPVGLVGRLE